MSGVVLSGALIAALGGLLFGFDTAVISGATTAVQEVFGLSGGALGFTVASALIGTILGSILVGRPADRWGRRTMLVVIALLYLFSAVGSALAWSLQGNSASPSSRQLDEVFAYSMPPVHIAPEPPHWVVLVEQVPFPL